MIDSYGRSIEYLRLSVTELCNLRCRYCMPADGVCKKRHEQMLSQEEMIRAIRIAASLGVRKLRITGGEPLVKRNILSICRRASEVEGIRELCISTNGTLLGPLAKPLKAAGVDRVNLSLDTLNAEKYADITRIGSLREALEGLDAALEAGFSRVKINTVLIGGFNDDEIPALAELTRRRPLDLRFIELMPMVDGGGFGPKAYLPCGTVLERLPELIPLDQTEGVSKLYRLPGAMGRIGLISPLSQQFCAQCNRIRLTADGVLKPCLHAAAEFPNKGMDDEQMRAQFCRAILAKPACHPELSDIKRSQAGRDMNRIGG